jgi:cation diffusion facilitator CzcD-associated flavoprotein CzcO
MTEKRDVIIVGGGIAGLTVAWRLLQQRPDL